MKDPLNPDYYKNYSIEVTDAIQSWGLNYCQGNIIKYIVRCGRKTADPTQDLEKALWYIRKELSQYVKRQLPQDSVEKSNQQNRSFAKQEKERTPPPTRSNGAVAEQIISVRT